MAHYSKGESHPPTDVFIPTLREDDAQWEARTYTCSQVLLFACLIKIEIENLKILSVCLQIHKEKLHCLIMSGCAATHDDNDEQMLSKRRRVKTTDNNDEVNEHHKGEEKSDESARCEINSCENFELDESKKIPKLHKEGEKCSSRIVSTGTTVLLGSNENKHRFKAKSKLTMAMMSMNSRSHFSSTSYSVHSRAK